MPSASAKHNYQNPREASRRSRKFLISLVYFCMYLFVSHLLAKQKNDTDLKFGTHSLRPYLKTGFLFFFFRKTDPEDRYPRKTAASRGFSAYLPDALFYFFIFYANSN